MKINLRTRIIAMTQTSLLILFLLILSQVSGVGANPAHSPKQNSGNGKKNGFKRPGTPTLIDAPGNGAGNGPFFSYQYDTFPVGGLFPSGYGYWWDRSKAHNFQHSSTNEGANTLGVDTYAKNLGVSYQNGNDQGKADRTLLHYVYIVNERMSAGFYKPFYNPASPTTDITLNITPSQGAAIPPQTLHLTPSSGSVGLGLGIPHTPVSISVPSLTTWEYTASKYNMGVHVMLPNTGSHTQKTQYIQPNTVTSRGEVSMTGQTAYAKAWGELAWDFYMATSSTNPKQIPWHFPPAKNGQNLIGFYQ